MNMFTQWPEPDKLKRERHNIFNVVDPEKNKRKIFDIRPIRYVVGKSLILKLN